MTAEVYRLQYNQSNGIFDRNGPLLIREPEYCSER
jgi:hypothetical protein